MKALRSATAAILTALALAAQPGPTETDVFVSGQGGYHTYRIPAIIRSAKGTLLAFCEGRKDHRGDAGNIDMLVKRSRDGGKTWSEPITIADFGADTIGNPAPVLDRRTGIVWLLLTRNPGDVPQKDTVPGLSGATRTVWVTHSKDDGVTWAQPTDITASVKLPDWSWYATGPGNGIQTKSGRMVIACDHSRGAILNRYSHVIYSDDGGATWKLGGSAGPLCNESAVAELPDGSLMLNMRSYAGRNRRAVSISRDAGLTWSEPRFDEALIEPVCQASLIRFGKRLLFSNPADKSRVNMTVRVSEDGGKTWAAHRSIHAGPSAYSNLVASKGNTVGLLYERGDRGPYERIVFARFPLAWVARK